MQCYNDAGIIINVLSNRAEWQPAVVFDNIDVLVVLIIRRNVFQTTSTLLHFHLTNRFVVSSMPHDGLCVGVFICLFNTEQRILIDTSTAMGWVCYSDWLTTVVFIRRHRCRLYAIIYDTHNGRTYVLFVMFPMIQREEDNAITQKGRLIFNLFSLTCRSSLLQATSVGW